MDNFTPNNSERLVQYLDGELSQSEQSMLEAELTSNKELAAELENFQLARQLVRKYGIKEQVANIHQEAMEEKQVARISQRTRILRYVAAAAASILIIFAINFYTNSSTGPEKLFADNYVTYQLNISRGEELTDEIETAFTAKNYKAVAENQTTELSIKDQFLKGVAFTETGNNQEAINNFLKVILRNAQAKTSLFNDEAQYYLSLVYLRMHDYPKSIDLMERIKADTGHTYHNRITDHLLEKIKRLQ